MYCDDPENVRSELPTLSSFQESEHRACTEVQRCGSLNFRRDGKVSHFGLYLNVVPRFSLFHASRAVMVTCPEQEKAAVRKVRLLQFFCFSLAFLLCLSLFLSPQTFERDRREQVVSLILFDRFPFYLCFGERLYQKYKQWQLFKADNSGPLKVYVAS